MSSATGSDGFSLIEVMVAMVITGIALMGAMAAVELSARHVRLGGLSNKAVDMAQARIEVKRSVRWQALLEDDLDHDGISETLMRDDGQGPDVSASDGIYTAMHEQDGVTVRWMVEFDRLGPLNSAAMVTIIATATYSNERGQKKEIQVATIRANPAYVGQP